MANAQITRCVHIFPIASPDFRTAMPFKISATGPEELSLSARFQVLLSEEIDTADLLYNTGCSRPVARFSLVGFILFDVIALCVNAQGCLPRRRRKSESSIKRFNVWARADTSPAGTKTPLRPSSITSEIAPTGVDMTGMPSANASRITIESFSAKDGSTRMSVRDSSSELGRGSLQLSRSDGSSPFGAGPQ